MPREATINVSLTSRQLRLVRDRVDSGRYQSESEVVREGLRLLFRQDPRDGTAAQRQLLRRLEAGYKQTAAHDRKLARDWAELPEAWPEE